MDIKVKDLMMELCDVLQKTSAEFLINRCKKVESISDMLDLILSSHVTSIVNLMKHTSSPDARIKKKVLLFIQELLQFLSKHHMLEVEFIGEEVH